ncbi:MAG: 4Fe-4S binding protein [Anaerolineae bacterium]|nr:4Fe-4S binding protein [Anaerolineae bacterium]
MAKAVTWRRIRQGVQILALLLFLYLLLGTRQGGVTFLPHDLFFRLDPLAGLTAMLAGRRWVASLALGGVTLLLALALGRVWCGWLCPLGTLLDWTRLRRHRSDGPGLPSGWRQVKHFLLFTLLFAALLGSLTLLVLDPLTLLFRTVAVAALPALNALVTAAETALYRFGPLQAPLELFDRAVRGWLLPVAQSFFGQNVLLALAFAAVLALNAIRPRFWCRYLCPLGALLGLFSKVAWLRHTVDEAACTACQRCARLCPTGTIDPQRDFAADPAECTLCLDCLASCPTKAIAFRGRWGLASWRGYDPSRRQVLASLGVAVAGAGLLRAASATRREHPRLIRPPGARENDLLDKCIRCGQCLQACPTAGLQPSLLESGLEGLWTPVLVPRLGYCDYSCHACGQVCPSGAIPELTLEGKRQTVIGVAYIDQNRCLPWADARPCIVCEEMCPVPEKAIRLQEERVQNAQGEWVTVQRPRVVRELCIGCGICEYQCPLNGEAAIRVYVPNAFAGGP